MVIRDGALGEVGASEAVAHIARVNRYLEEGQNSSLESKDGFVLSPSRRSKVRKNERETSGSMCRVFRANLAISGLELATRKDRSGGGKFMLPSKFPLDVSSTVK